MELLKLVPAITFSSNTSPNNNGRVYVVFEYDELAKYVSIRSEYSFPIEFKDVELPE